MRHTSEKLVISRNAPQLWRAAEVANVIDPPKLQGKGKYRPPNFPRSAIISEI